MSLAQVLELLFDQGHHFIQPIISINSFKNTPTKRCALE